MAQIKKTQLSDIDYRLGIVARKIKYWENKRRRLMDRRGQFTVPFRSGDKVIYQDDLNHVYSVQSISWNEADRYTIATVRVRSDGTPGKTYRFFYSYKDLKRVVIRVRRYYQRKVLFAKAGLGT